MRNVTRCKIKAIRVEFQKRDTNFPITYDHYLEPVYSMRESYLSWLWENTLYLFVRSDKTTIAELPKKVRLFLIPIASCLVRIKRQKKYLIHMPKKENGNSGTGSAKCLQVW